MASKEHMHEIDMPSFRTLKVIVIIPALNEELTIKQTIDEIRSCRLTAAAAVILDVSIWVIDGGSTDSTREICYAQEVKTIIQKGKGKGNAMREAIEKLKTEIADIVIFMDGDATYCPSDLGRLISPLLNNEADMVVGSRFLGSKEKGSMSVLNMIGNKIFNRTINFSMSSSITDSLSGFRALNVEVLKQLILFSGAFEIEVEMTVEVLSKGYRVLEVPIDYKARKRPSDTKLNPVNDGLKIARTLIFILMNINPLKFFGVLSLGFFAVALWPTSQVFYEKLFHGHIVSIPAVVLSALLVITAVLSIVMGMLAELVVRSRRRLEFMISNKRIE
jgi:dolichol-phosphate mannosyltransferase